MNNIQKLINELEFEKEKASPEFIRLSGRKFGKSYLSGKFYAFSFIIQKLELLLKDESKQPQPPDCANTMLGEVPHGVNDQQEENLKAVEGATPVVRQNEQTKEVCPSCKSEDLFDVDDHWTKCNSCGFSFVG